MGIDYGICHECTPDWVFEEKMKFEQAMRDITSFINHEYGAEEASLVRRKQDSHASLAKVATQEYDLVYEAGKDWYKNNS
jgi:hypothetical protein